MGNQTQGPAKSSGTINFRTHDGRTLTTAEDIGAYAVEMAAAKDAADKVAAEARAALDARTAEDANKPAAGSFRVKVAKYSVKPNRTTGKVHANAGKSKGTIEVYSGPSLYAAMTVALDQWEDIKAHVGDIDKFIAEHRGELKTMTEILSAYGG